MPKDMPLELSIVHLSDLHFHGYDKHRFPWKTVSGDDNPDYNQLPKLHDLLKKDLGSLKGTATNVLLICSGDFTQKNDESEFEKASVFLEEMIGTTVGATKLEKKNVFIVPGNHDVNFLLEVNDPNRWKDFHAFYSGFYGDVRAVQALGAERFTRVVDRLDDLNTIVLEINTSWFVKHGTEASYRGQIEQDEISRITADLNSLETEKKEKFDNSFKIAVMHHHPVLMPAFAEIGRKYDAIEDASLLLKELRRHGFQLIIHGHKHNPHTFRYDPVCAWEKINTFSCLIVAGGSVSSTEVASNGANTYNVIDLKRATGRKDTVIQVQTRKLQMFDSESNELLARNQWKFFELANRRCSVGYRKGNLSWSETFADLDLKSDKLHQQLLGYRSETLAKLRGNMLVAEVRQTFVTDQSYEAFIRIAENVNEEFPRELPGRVDWFFGKQFMKVASCTKDDGDEFRTRFEFFGAGVMVVAQLTFGDGSKELGYVFAAPPTIEQ